MWMMGYNDEFNMPDSFNGRKLRPLIPRPAVNNMPSSSPTPPCITRIHGTDFFALNHHLATMAEQNKREFNIQPSSVVVSSRWNPTPEQLRTLEELYRRGTRTPSAEQIQHITAQLRRYGKIEGKNVFYWFQNHKARERQKRRRQMESPQEHDQEMVERKDNSSGGGSSRVAGYEGEQNKNWAPSSTHCSSTPSELQQEANTVQQIRATTKAAAAAGAATAMAECRSDGWVHYEELQQRRHFVERNATWQKMQLSCPARATTTSPTTTSSTIVSATATTPTTTPPRLFKTSSVHVHDHNYLHHQEQLKNIFVSPPLPSYGTHHLHHSFNCVFDGGDDDQEQEKEQTLELFPLRSENTGQSCNGMGGSYQKLSVSAMDATGFGANHQFFEFLPLKN